MKARGRQAQDREDPAKTEDAPGAIDGAREPRLVGFGDLDPGEIGWERLHGGEQDPQDGHESPDALLETGEPQTQSGDLLVRVEVHRRATPLPEPPRGRGPGDPARTAMLGSRLSWTRRTRRWS